MIPVVVRPCDWKSSPFAELQVLPKDGHPVTLWTDRDQAWLDVVQGLRAAIAEHRRVGGDASAGKPVPLRRDERKPRYADAESRQLSRRLKSLFKHRRELTLAGDDTVAVEAEILDVRRLLRRGPQLRPGEFLGDGRYELIEVVGQGGFATVWQAWDGDQELPVALKVLHGHYSEDRGKRERFFRGARKMADLAHPHIVRVLDGECADDGWHFFVMEYLSGGNFEQAVLGGELTEERRLEILLEAGEALEYAHRRGAVHRDVKPSNILLDVEGGAKLSDFDLVRAADTTGLTATRAMMGTVQFAAPEALESAGAAGPPADVYSLGSTAVFALGGRLPAWYYRDPARAIRGLDCSAELKRVLERATGRSDLRSSLGRRGSAGPPGPAPGGIPPPKRIAPRRRTPSGARSDEVPQAPEDMAPGQETAAGDSEIFAPLASPAEPVISETAVPPGLDMRTGKRTEARPGRWRWILGAGVLTVVAVALSTWLPLLWMGEAPERIASSPPVSAPTPEIESPAAEPSAGGEAGTETVGEAEPPPPPPPRLEPSTAGSAVPAVVGGSREPEAADVRPSPPPARELPADRTGKDDSKPEPPAAGTLETGPLGMRFRYIPGGRFQMGSPKTETERDDDENLHEVKLNHGFWMGETEVTQAQWRELMQTDPSRFEECGDDCPVERVNWYEAVEFANRRSDRAGLAKCYLLEGRSGTLGAGCDEGESYCSGDYACETVTLRDLECEGFRLPTEAEWEYAARAGEAGPIYSGKLNIEGTRNQKHSGAGSDRLVRWQQQGRLSRWLGLLGLVGEAVSERELRHPSRRPEGAERMADPRHPGQRPGVDLGPVRGLPAGNSDGPCRRRDGLAPGCPRRWLEQQRPPLPVGEPLQARPRLSQRVRRVSSREDGRLTLCSFTLLPFYPLPRRSGGSERGEAKPPLAPGAAGARHGRRCQRAGQSSMPSPIGDAGDGPVRAEIAFYSIVAKSQRVDRQLRRRHSADLRRRSLLQRRRVLQRRHRQLRRRDQSLLRLSDLQRDTWLHENTQRGFTSDGRAFEPRRGGGV